MPLSLTRCAIVAAHQKVIVVVIFGLLDLLAFDFALAAYALSVAVLAADTKPIHNEPTSQSLFVSRASFFAGIHMIDRT